MSDAPNCRLIRSDRACVPLLQAALRCAPTSVSPEVGEEFRLFDLAPQIDAAALARVGLVRFAMPVALTMPTHDLATGDARTLMRLDALRGDVDQAAVFPLRRHGRFAASRLVTLLREKIGTVSDPRRPSLFVAVSDELAFAGIASLASTGAATPGGWQMTSKSDYPSRAGGKLDEALAWLAVHGHVPPNGAAWLELGAYPGGMTAALSRRGYSVLAVDLSESFDEVMRLPNVVYQVADAEGYTTSTTFDALLSDMNGPPERAAPTVARLCAAVRPGGLVIHTIKLSAWTDLSPVLALVRAHLAAADVEEIAVKHLVYNRQEVTFLGQKRPTSIQKPSEVGLWRPM